MKKRTLLNEEELKGNLAKFSKWKLVRGKLHRELEFASFVEAFGFMSSVAVVAESMNHHPDWFNSWNKVKIDLVTHDLKGISHLDFELARKIDALASRYYS